jgi:hypothetical protein
MNGLVINEENIQNKIYTIRGVQVMLDEDLAKLYQVETKTFNQAVKRNIARFPEHFRFQLTKEEYEYILRSQIVTLKENLNKDMRGKHRKYLPYVFTEQGVSMLSAILRSDIAIEVSIKIIDAFVNMRRFLLSNASIFQRLDNIEYKLLKHDENFDKVFKAIESKDIKPIQGIFYDGQIYDAYVFVNDLLKSAKKEVTLIDNYIDDSILTLFSKYPDIGFTIITKSISEQLKLDIKKYNAQYNNLTIKTSNKFHDRFLIIDNKETYHVGASLKDLGKKVFGFSKIDVKLLQKIINVKDMRGK